MSIDEIQGTLLEVLKEVQAIRGRAWTELSQANTPIKDLDGFDSLTSVECTVMVEGKLGCAGFGTASIFVDEDGRRPLTIKETAIRIKNILDKNGKKK